MSVYTMARVWTVLSEVDLGLAARLILLGLANHADAAGENAFPSVGRLAAYTGLSVRAVQQTLRRLERAGLITVAAPARRYRPTTYTVLAGVTPGSPLTGPGVKPGSPLTGPGVKPGSPLTGPGVKPGSPLNTPGVKPGSPRGEARGIPDICTEPSINRTYGEKELRPAGGPLHDGGDHDGDEEQKATTFFGQLPAAIRKELEAVARRDFSSFEGRVTPAKFADFLRRGAVRELRRRAHGDVARFVAEQQAGKNEGADEQNRA